MITWNDLTAELQHNLAAVATGTEIAYRYWEDLHNSGLATLDGQYRMRLTDAGRAVLAQKPANDSGAAVDVSALQSENARLQRELEAARTALENIADYDVKYEHGFIDEWNEAESFTIVQKIAADALAAKAGSK